MRIRCSKKWSTNQETCSKREPKWEPKASENGIKIVKELEFPDHYEYSEKDINKILSEANKLNSKILTTEKDYLRIKSENLSQIKYIKSELKIMNEDEFFKSLI